MKKMIDADLGFGFLLVAALIYIAPPLLFLMAIIFFFILQKRVRLTSRLQFFIFCIVTISYCGLLVAYYKFFLKDLVVYFTLAVTPLVFGYMIYLAGKYKKVK